MRIITISRQFSSGGRELGKRLSDILGWDYYDREIIERLSQDQGLDSDYVSSILTTHQWNTVPLTFQTSFTDPIFSPDTESNLLIRQREIIEEIAKAGNDCIIVGRDADIILSEYRPLRIFVCAEMENRIERCRKQEESKPENERLTDKEIERNIRQIDKGRSQIRELLTGLPWGDSSAFDLTVNSSGWQIKALAPAVADFALKWFER